MLEDMPANYFGGILGTLEMRQKRHGDGRLETFEIQP